MTNAADAAIDRALSGSFKRAGQADIATFKFGGNSVSNCDVYVNRGVALHGDQSQVVDDATTIEASLAQLGRLPANGDRFVIGSETFEVDTIGSKDETYVLCIVTEKGIC